MLVPTARPGLAKIGGPMAPIPELALPGMHRLCSNENPFGPGAAVIAAVTKALSRAGDYPEGEGADLLEALARRYGVAADRIRLGPGSDTLVLNSVLAFAGPGDEVVFSARGYARYARNALIAGATPVPAPDHDFRPDPEAILAAVTPRTRVVLIANPDNPSGRHSAALRDRGSASPPARRRAAGAGLRVRRIRSRPRLRRWRIGPLGAKADNVVVSHTFSKLYGLAGMRLGWLTGSPALLDAVAKVGPTFPVSVPCPGGRPGGTGRHGASGGFAGP